MWVYTVKYHPNGSIECLKARLWQKYIPKHIVWIICRLTFSWLCWILFTFLSLWRLITNRLMYQLDIKNAFLHGDL